MFCYAFDGGNNMVERVTDWHDNVGRRAGRDEIFDFTKRPNLDLVPEEKKTERSSAKVTRKCNIDSVKLHVEVRLK